MPGTARSIEAGTIYHATGSSATDGFALYPEPISGVFGDVPHQLCEFHVIKELTKAVLRAVAKVRKEDDKLLTSTSNAVERGYRRHRKTQKTVYRVRTKPNMLVTNHLGHAARGAGSTP
jgi:hypothetical protein